jgi:hypothetical protein
MGCAAIRGNSQNEEFTMQWRHAAAGLLVGWVVGYAGPAAALSVRVDLTASSPATNLLYVDQDSNFGISTDPLSSLSFLHQPGVTGSSPPLFNLIDLSGEADGREGRLAAATTLRNTGGATGGIVGATGSAAARISEGFRVKLDDSGPMKGTQGLGNPDDDFITIRVRGRLDGSAVVGSPGGVPQGVTDAGMATGSLVLSLGPSASLASLTFTDIATLGSSVRTATGSVPTLPVQRGVLEVDASGSILFHLRRSWVQANPTDIYTVGAVLSTEGRVADFAGAEAVADYAHTALFDMQVEDGYSWISQSGNFLTTPLYTAPVPEPSTAALCAGGLLALVGLARRRACRGKGGVGRTAISLR